MSEARQCRAIVVTAPASGQGKTTVTAALARSLRDRGQRVRVFKVGADFLDPMLLERASGAPVYQLDLWMCGEDQCRALLHEAAAVADCIIVEGVMGLFDGDPSTADLARRLSLPVMPVIDASAMAQTFGAIACGLARYDPDLRCIGAVANRVASEGHAAMLAASMPADLPLLASLPFQADAQLPDRYLGLHQPDEIPDLELRLQRLAQSWPANAWPAQAWPPWPSQSASVGEVRRSDVVAFERSELPAPLRILQGLRIAIARDEAFAFLYPANVDTLRALGAQPVFFSPLHDRSLPDADAIYLPGGYPELHAQQLAQNRALIEQLRAHCHAGKRLLAECGGMMYLLESLTTAQGERVPMAALLPGEVRMQDSVAALALQQVELPEGTLRGHTFHQSRMSTPLRPIATGCCPSRGRTAEHVYRHGPITASYVHLYFASNPEAVAATLVTPKAVPRVADPRPRSDRPG